MLSREAIGNFHIQEAQEMSSDKEQKRDIKAEHYFCIVTSLTWKGNLLTIGESFIRSNAPKTQCQIACAFAKN